MKIAIMQPYFIPYIGYFQLINAVDVFVFYDDVNFIKRGWINRNNILVNNEPQLITLPLKKSSQNKRINEVELALDQKIINKIISTITHSYKKAPFFKEVMSVFEDVINKKCNNIAELAIESVIVMSNYIGINTKFLISSESFRETRGLIKADRLIQISKQTKCIDYINAIGGMEIYSKEYFNSFGIRLYFLESLSIEYKQYNNKFVPILSILDVLMFNPINDVKKYLENYKLL